MFLYCFIEGLITVFQNIYFHQTVRGWKIPFSPKFEKYAFKSQLDKNYWIEALKYVKMYMYTVWMVAYIR